MRLEHYIILMLLLMGFVSMPLLIPTIKTTQPYSIFNTKELGCSNFLVLMHKNNTIKPILYPYNDISIKENSVMFIIAPDVDFTKKDGEFLKNYVYSGNTLIIADNFNKGNNLLQYMNISNKFSNKPLYDIIEPIALYNQGYILLGNPTAITGSTEGDINLLSSESSNIGKYPKPGKEKSYPLILKKDYGDGKIILISDPNILTNGLFNANEKFLKYYFNYSNKYIYFDEYHHSDVNPQNMATIVVNNNNITPKFLSYLSIIILIITVIVESSNNIYIKLINKIGNNKLLKHLNEKNNNKINFEGILNNTIKKYGMDKTIVYKILDKMK
ncbi:DUF4350 domain-containing protein [Methanothermococcus sp.]|uniref:DUF4350 domain-containing protein n=1 Tax=Methanothermococcus sp. TaxID=2614238 RepID=UPI0025D9DB8F|nr:DUF4350 domain-containing protein [Methanothermococcus sp.]